MQYMDLVQMLNGKAIVNCQLLDNPVNLNMFTLFDGNNKSVSFFVVV